MFLDSYILVRINNVTAELIHYFTYSFNRLMSHLTTWLNHVNNTLLVRHIRMIELDQSRHPDLRPNKPILTHSMNIKMIL